MLIVAADSSKLGKNVFARITDAKKADILVTNKTENHTEVAKLRDLGLDIYEA